MKNVQRIILLLGLSCSVLLAGCTARIYGVPKDEWQHMPPAEQQQVRAAYLERQRLYEERRLYEAKQRAHEAELRAQQAREEESSRHPSQQYRDTAPDIIHFTLEGGTVYVAGRHRPFEPVTLELRRGESKRLTLQTTDDRRPYHVSLVCSYQDGRLWLSNGSSRVHARQIAYDRGWHAGQRYQDLELGGGVGMRGAVVWVANGAIPAVNDSRGPSRPQPTPSGSASRVIVDFDDKLQQRGHSKSDCKEGRRQAGCDTVDSQTHPDKQSPAVQASTPGHNAQANRDNGNNQRGNTPGQENRDNGHSGQDRNRQHSQETPRSRDTGGQGSVHSASRGNPPGQAKSEHQPLKKTEQGEGHSLSDTPAKAQSGKPHKPNNPGQSQAKAKSQDENAGEGAADAAKTKGKDKGKRQDGNNSAESCDEDDSQGKDKQAECEDGTVARGKRNK